MTEQLLNLLAVIDLEGKIVSGIRNFQDYLASSGEINRVPPENLHIVLSRFEGVSEHKLRDLFRALDNIYFEDFTVKLGSCLIQPSLETPQTIWVQVSEGAEQLRRLALEINENALQAGFKPVRGTFNPQIKIAEIKSIKDEGSLRAAVYRLLRVRIGKLEVRTIKLKREVSPQTMETIYEVKATESYI